MDGLQLLNLVPPAQRQTILRFVDAYRHTRDTVTSLSHMEWVAQAMQLMAATPLNNEQKKKLVIGLYHDLSKDDTNAFQDTFDVSAAIEFVWDVSRDKFGLVLRRKGCLTRCLPCCSQVEVMVDRGQVHVSAQPLPPDPAAPPA